MWFPRLASERALRLWPCDGPFALVHRAANADHLHCLSPEAEARGLHRGMSLPDARAMCPALVTRPADLPREMAFLRMLARWAGRYSPWTARDGSDGVVADITGAAHLFGGEAALVADLAARLGRAGLTVRAAIADTRGAAHALARHGGGIAAPGATRAALGRLPLSALRIDSETVAGLNRLGLRRIADLADLPRAPLSRRFGAGLLLRLDQALGIQPEPLSSETGLPHFGVRMTLPEPIGLVSDVMAGLDRLLDRLSDRLAAAGQGARRLRLELGRVDRSTVLAEIGLARPMRDARRIAALFRPAVEDIDAGFGIDMMRLTVTQAEPLAARQVSAGGEVAGDRLSDLVSRLGNRLGFEAIQRFAPAESHIPERSFLTLPAAHAEAAPWPPAADAPERPILLFRPEPLVPLAPCAAEPPARFRWRRMELTRARTRGPERIAPEWWFDDPAWRNGLRDYWKVETREGWRLWLFHTPQNPDWYAHGTFA